MGKQEIPRIVQQVRIWREGGQQDQQESSQGDDRKDAGGQQAVWLHLQPWPGEERGEERPGMVDLDKNTNVNFPMIKLNLT